ncbi:hypothetical protein SNOG_16013 [Parastagonospora nodorum SN15]|uniref:BOD1/SHG1 domain-containing protein n=1 Tax=Phaeosphaeria nodorum (strain SN15 / ATCC MYA-4574 / FGSC 10173) TaxID=321614 RepID=Q0TWU5_PHANO|nr:hypothetical protein SNOG_16013 [Parastagonospora nodorum SN15]EAT76592.2 hypothetical protein SNOG_16013 [Parastagonospora nodorum SN15]
MAEVGRKRVLDGEGPQHSAKDDLLTSLKDLVETETDRNPHLLSKDPRMATTLIEGAGERINIYGNIMNTVSSLLDNLIKEQGLPKMREYRALEIGAEAAAEEEQRGSKTEEEWAAEAETRRKEREAIREKELEHQRQIEREERAKKEERKRREKEQDEAREKARQEEKERRRKEREERDRADVERRRKERERIDKEREEERARLKKEREEHDATREARLQRIRDEDAQRVRELEEKLERERAVGHLNETGHAIDAVFAIEVGEGPSVKPEDIKVDDDLALQLLLQESEQMKKSRQRPALERSESLEPPMRRAQPPKSLVPRDPVATRLAKLDSKSQSPAPSPEKEPATPKGDGDVEMEDAPQTDKSRDTTSRSRWDIRPALPTKDDKSRGRSRSPSIAHSTPKLVRHLEAVVTIVDHLASKMIAGLAEMMTDILTVHATIETTGDRAAEVGVVLAKLPAVASPAMIREAHLPETATRTVAVIAAAHVRVEDAELVNVPRRHVAVTIRARGVRTASTDMCLQVESPKLQPQMVLLPFLLPELLRQPLSLAMLSLAMLSLASVTTAATEIETVTASVMTAVPESATIADRGNEMTLATATGATDLASMIAGMVADLGQTDLTNQIGISLEAAVVTRSLTRRRGIGVEAVIETGIGIVVGMIVIGEGV